VIDKKDIGGLMLFIPAILCLFISAYVWAGFLGIVIFIYVGVAVCLVMS